MSTTSSRRIVYANLGGCGRFGKELWSSRTRRTVRLLQRHVGSTKDKWQGWCGSVNHSTQGRLKALALNQDHPSFSGCHKLMRKEVSMAELPSVIGDAIGRRVPAEV
jgi:hypothetical protein